MASCLTMYEYFNYNYVSLATGQIYILFTGIKPNIDFSFVFVLIKQCNHKYGGHLNVCVQCSSVLFNNSIPEVQG